MALVFCDSFDHYALAQMTTKWQLAGTSFSLTVGNGRNGTASMRGSNFAETAQKTVPAAATYIVGVAYRSLNILVQQCILRFQESGTLHVDVRVDATGKLSATRNGTVLGTGTTVLSPNVFYYVEAKATIHDTTGSIVVKLNGVTEINLTNVDTRNGATGVIDTIVLGPPLAAGLNPDWDDLYVCDTTGSAPTNDFLGDVRVQALLPSGNGNSSQLVGSDGNSTDNYLLVDESTPNSDTDYVESSTVGDKDTYAFGDLTPTTGTVYGVQVLPFARKTDAGARSIVSVARLSATEADGAAKTLSTTYAYLPDIRESKPGGGAWSISDVNSAEFGVKVSA